MDRASSRRSRVALLRRSVTRTAPSCAFLWHKLARAGPLLLLLLGLLLGAWCPSVAQVSNFGSRYPVGGNPGAEWSKPASPQFYQDWADQLTLYANDSIIFEYDASLYDVTLLSTQEQYLACSVDSSASYSTGGETEVLFVEPGPFYFTSSGGSNGSDTGTSSNCLSGMRFQVEVFPYDFPINKGFAKPPPATSPSAEPSPSLEPPLSPPAAAEPPSSHGPGLKSPPPEAPVPAGPPPPPPFLPGTPGGSQGAPSSPPTAAPTQEVIVQLSVQWSPQADDPSFYNRLYMHMSPVTSHADGLLLVFNYTRNQHNVLQVTQLQFANCTIPRRPQAQYANPSIAVSVLRDGLYYFIDGVADNCAKGNMKLEVQLGMESSPPNFPPPGPARAPPPPPHLYNLSPVPSPVVSASPQPDKNFPVTAVVVPCVLALGLGLTFAWCMCYRRQQHAGKYQRSSTGMTKKTFLFSPTGFGGSPLISPGRTDNLSGGRGIHNQQHNVCTIFSLKELEKATNNFSPDTEIGRGGFGTVYKGTLSLAGTETRVAIKRTKNAGASDLSDFTNEVSILSQLNNRHLVKLLGCCVDQAVPLLVYEFVPNGTLQDHLSAARQGLSTELDWPVRLKIAVQTAEALKYLHVGATPPIFHRDVKAANILLDHGFNAKVADFGLSKLVQDLDASHVSTAVRGTPGYLDPEYFHNFQVTDKTDVYSFGVVLLELITSQKPIDMAREEGDQNLAMRCVPLVRAGRLEEVVDRHVLAGLSKEDLQAVHAVAQVAVACLLPVRAARPSMSEVVEMLQRVKRSELSAEEFYSRAAAAAAPAYDPYSLVEMEAVAYSTSRSFTESTSSRKAARSGSFEVSLSLSSR